MRVKGDFCYVIWFDDRKDAAFFKALLSKKGFPAWRILFRTGDIAVFWDIGMH